MPEQPAPDDGMTRLHAVELDLAQSKLALENQATTLDDINLQLSQIAHLLSQIPAPPNHPIPPTPPRPPPSTTPVLNPGVPMEIDAARCHQQLPGACRCCGKLGHWTRECPQAFDI